MKHFFLSFYSSNNSQNPHSFPTRRSSDLTIPPVAREALLDRHRRVGRLARRLLGPIETEGGDDPRRTPPLEDRKSTRLNSSHPSISYAVFCLKKKIMTFLTSSTSLRIQLL